MGNRKPWLQEFAEAACVCCFCQEPIAEGDVIRSRGALLPFFCSAGCGALFERGVPLPGPAEHAFVPVKAQSGCARCGYARGHHPARRRLTSA